MNETAPAIEAIDIARSFGGVRALTAGNLAAQFGEVHGLVGENGAGKSTLIKVLGGVIRPESGVVRFDGEDVTDSIAAAARAHGVGMVFQELTLFPWMTVAENLFAGSEPRGASRLIQRRKLGTLAEEVLERYDVHGIDPRALAGSLPLAQRQIVEITAAFMREPRILFLDEPTSALAEHDVAWLFGLVRELRDAGAAILFTSHRWNEVASLADRITILRNGEHVATRERIDEAEAVTLMTGRTIDRMYPELLPPPPSEAEVALEVRELRGTLVDGMSLELRRGEILGIGGLAGQGQRDLFMTLFGARRATGGEILVGGKPKRIRRPHDAIEAGLGIALVPEDRKSEGLLLPLSVRDNLTLAVLRRISAAGVIRPRAEGSLVRRIVARLAVRTRHPATQEVGTLSGGNQQK